MEDWKKTMNDNAISTQRSADKVEISIHLDAEVLEQLKHLTNDPSRIIETAIKQWLNGERGRDDDLTRTFRRNPPLPPRGEWND
jgi:post-segregation antitoxin (ccd killing protein)